MPTYTATPLDSSSTPIPMGSVVPTTTNTPIPLEGGPTQSNGGNPVAPASMWVRDGNDVTAGAKADAPVTDATVTTATRMSFIKGFVKILADTWDSTNHWLQVKVMNGNANGQATMSNSAPVVIANDQSAVTIKGNAVEVSGLSAAALNANLVASLDVSGYKWLSLHIGSNAYSGNLHFYCSNNGTDWKNYNLFAQDTTTYASSTGNTNALFAGPVFFRYLKVVMASYTSGTAQAVLELYASPAPFQWMQASLFGTPSFIAFAAIFGGSSDFHLVSAAGTNVTSIKNFIGQIYGYEIFNASASTRYVKFYDTAGTPTVGTDTPYRTVGIAAGSRAQFHSSTGLQFNNGIAFATVTGAADSNSTGVSVGDLTIDIDYAQ